MTAGNRGPNRVAQTIAVVAVTLVGTRVFLVGGVSVGFVVSVVLIPLWLPSVRRYSGGILLMGVGLLAAVSGAWLTDFASATHTTSLSGVVDATVMMIGLLGAIGVLLWARELLPLWLIGTLFGTGMLATVIVSGSWDPGNPWKFGIGFPLMVIALSLVSRPGMRVADLSVVLLLSGFAVMTDSRYRFASLMIAAVLLLWQMFPKPKTRRRSAVTAIVVISAITVLVYNLATAVLLEGYLGEEAQARSIDQIDRSGSLIVGGRPELSASIALFLDRPFGFGSGVLPTQHDILTAKTGMAAIGYDPNNGYVERFMFGGGFELHSVAGDLWAAFGLAGLAFAALVVVFIVQSLARTLADHTATGLLVFLIISTLWNVLFSPIYGSLPTLVLTLGLALLPRSRVAPATLTPSRGLRTGAFA